MKINQLFFLALMPFFFSSYAQNAQDLMQIKTIELVNFTHVDYGFTDNPIIAMDLQKRFIDIVLDAVTETADSSEYSKFYWTIETLDPLYQWWLEADSERKSLLIKAIESGQIDVNILPFHPQSFLNERQWNVFLNWIPVDLYKKFQPSFSMMNDVNGFPRTGAIKLLDKGINKIWMSINNISGGAPFTQPSAFWWKMPDGRKMLVWNGQSYWMGYNFFAMKDWRLQQHQANNTQFRTPRIGDIFLSDEKSVREAHRICVDKLSQMIKEGYSYDFVAVSFSNQWRCDNDGPFPPIIDFVKKWNQLGLQPAIHFTTVSKALNVIEKKLGNTIKTYEGEWPDWWTFGGASSPNEVSAARQANNYIEALLSPVWGEPTDKINRKVYEMEKELCLFYEHTYASNESESNPYSLYNIGHIAEKRILAYRPYEKSKWLLAQRTRSLITNQEEGLYAANTGKTPYSGWLTVDIDAFNGAKYKSVVDVESQEKIPLQIEKKTARLWVENFEANKIKRFKLSVDSVASPTHFRTPQIVTNNFGWPVSCQWKGMEKPLFLGSMADFMSMESKIGRNLEWKVWYNNNTEQRLDTLKASATEIWAKEISKAEVIETPYSIIYKQKIVHPRLNMAERKIEIWKNEERAQITLKLDRISSANPEIFYVVFALPQTDGYPVVSNAGNEFLPYKNQIPGTCTDFFTTDGWVYYPSAHGSWIWSCRDMPLVAFGGNNYAQKSQTAPKEMNKIYSMVYNNLWFCNFPDNIPGEIKFQYDLVWKNKITNSKEIPEIVQTYYLPPVIMINPQTREDKHTFVRMNEIK